MEEILVIDDEKKMHRILQLALEGIGCRVRTAGTGMEGVDLARSRLPALVITDMKMPGMSGMDVLEEMKKIDDQVPVIIMTAYGTVQTAVDAMKAGAFDYILKPFDIAEMEVITRKALEYRKLSREIVQLRSELQSKYRFDNIIGKSPGMQRIFNLITQIAPTKSTIMIRGESGTGKDLIAGSIHCHSDRASTPFIKLNCGAIPGTLLESELFGYEKGAFTGADRQKPGRFELADGGTLFLDEIGDMDAALQVKLLRVLQNGELEHLGGTRTLQVDVRVIAATNTNLEQRMREGRFREDLYYRINVVPIEIPPLRERREDIPLLVHFFMDKYAKEMNRGEKNITSEAMEQFIHYDWPGNIRELQNMIERAIVLSRSDTLSPRSFSFPDQQSRSSGHREEVRIPKEGISLTQVVEELEKAYLQKALIQSGGIQTKAADLLGITRKILRYKMEKFGL
ncbi:MAG: sigma-54-dependent Fis family transcriptional regulator [Deltaproteobacteria bacterium]|nr:sigma-54-dependent Fis family transcriptional regulator [Deltaproteobacteria bacterium]